MQNIKKKSGNISLDALSIARWEILEDSVWLWVGDLPASLSVGVGVFGWKSAYKRRKKKGI